LDIYDGETWRLVKHIATDQAVRDANFVDEDRYLWAHGRVWMSGTWEEVQLNIDPQTGLIDEKQDPLSAFLIRTENIVPSPGSRHIADIRSRNVRIFDLLSGEITSLDAISDPADVVFSPDNSLVAVWGGDSIAVYRPGSYTPLLELTAEGISEPSFSEDGQLLSFVDGGYLRVVSTLDGGTRYEFAEADESSGFFTEDGNVLLVNYMTIEEHEDYRELISGPTDLYKVQEGDLGTRNRLAPPECDYSTSPLEVRRGIFLLCDGVEILEIDPTTLAWSGLVNDVETTLPYSFSYSHDLQTLLAIWPERFRVLRPEQGIAEGAQEVYLGQISSVSISPNGEYLAIGTEGYRSVVWSLSTGDELYDDDYSGRVSFSPLGTLFTTGSYGSRFPLIDTVNWTETSDYYPDTSLSGDSDVATWGPYRFSPNGRQICIELLDSAVVWNTDSQTVARIIEPNSVDPDLYIDSIEPFVFSKDGTLLAVHTWKPYVEGIQVWNLADGNLVSTFELIQHTNTIHFAFDNSMILTEWVKGGPGYFAWDVGTGELINEIHETQYVWVPSEDRLMELNEWNLQGEADWVYSEAVLPEERKLRTYSGSVLYLFQDSAWSSLSDRTNGLSRLSLRTDLLVHHGQQEMLLSDPLSGARLHQFGQIEAPLLDYGFSPDGRFIVLALRDGVIEIWGIPR
jgi:WD40 repeat protein